MPITYGGHIQELRHVVKLAGGRVRWNKDDTITVTIGKRMWRLKTNEEVTIAAGTIRAMKNPGLSTLRGSGPPPPGFYRCWDKKCPARSIPGRGFIKSKVGQHYHPVTREGVADQIRPPRQNPARWAHGVMSYRRPPGSVQTMMNNPRGGQYYLNRRRRRNPHRRNPSKGGGTNWLLIGGLAVGAFFLLRPTTAGASPFSTLFGGGTTAMVPPGYTPIGSGLYRSPTGQIVARNPQTGQMVMAPAGSVPTSAEDLLTRAGISLIPSVANTLASWVSSMFSTQQTSTGAVVPWGSGVSEPYQEWGGAMPGGESIFGDVALPALAPLPDPSGYSLWEGSQISEEGIFGGDESLPPLTELPTYPTYDWGDAYWGSDWDAYAGGYEVPGLPPVDYDVMIGVGSGEVTIANPDEWYGFFGLGRNRRRSYPGLRATPPVY